MATSTLNLSGAAAIYNSARETFTDLKTGQTLAVGSGRKIELTDAGQKLGLNLAEMARASSPKANPLVSGSTLVAPAAPTIGAPADALTKKGSATNTTETPAAKPGPQLRYPKSTVGTQDYVLFEQIKYVAGGAGALSTGAIARPTERLAKAEIIQSVILPIPSNVSSDNTVGWGDDKLDFVKAMVGGGVAGVIEGGAALDQALSNIGNTVSSNKESLKKLLTTSVAGQIAGSNLFTRATGAIANSNLELLFSGPELRSFTFTYRMTPREEAEATEIKSIIRHFKKGMAPVLGQGNLFVQTPNVFKIKFKFNGNEDHPFLDRIKVCALTNFRANYTPDGAYTTYKNGSPIAYEIAMTFKELDPVYSQDYDIGDGQTGMGF